ncbi:MAG TPA: sialidase family protein [Gemmataceae bacterium]
MSQSVRIPNLAVLLALAFVGCNKVDQGDSKPWASPPTAQTEQRKPASQTVLKEPTAEPIKVTLLRVPNDGIQPQAVADADGTLHLVYFKGEKANAGDLFYVRREAGKERFSEPIRINSKPNSACAMGSVRGGQITLGKGGRPHVVWNGVGTDYARLDDAGTAFEEQRNLMRQTDVPDGGGTVAADDAGNVYVVWHGQAKGVRGEDKRQVWVARSTDDGKTFSMEEPAWAEPTGVCPCCSTRAFADHKGIVYLLYRSATVQVNRGTYLLFSEDLGKTFRKALVHDWKVPG